MRILAINDRSEAGGAAQLFRRTNVLLRQAGHEVVEITGDTLGLEPAVPGSWLGRLRWQAREAVRQVHAPGLIARIERAVAGREFDVAHVHNLHDRLSTHVLRWLAKRRIPVAYQINDYFFFCNSYVAYNRRLDAPCKRCIGGHAWWALRYRCVNNLAPGRFATALLQALMRLALRAARPWRGVQVFLVTSDQSASLLAEWGVERGRQHKLLNPMVAREFDVPTSLGDEIVFFGAAVPSKGTETFLQALEHVQAPCRIGVYLTGMTDDYASRLRQVVQRRGLRLTADAQLRWSQGLKARVAASRAVVVPSQWWATSESVVYEAMLLGKPVILSRMGGNVELVEHGETGLLFESRNAKELARCMDALAEDAALAGRMGAAAKARARVRFAEDVFMKSLESAYQQARLAAGLIGQPAAWPTVSVVTPSFNQAQFLEQTIQSVLGQDYPKLEYAIFDGGSTDGSAEIITRYADRLSYWVSEPDGGQADAVNKGWRRATGEILAYLNSDDAYLPGAIRRAVDYFHAHPDADILYGAEAFMDESGRESEPPFTPPGCSIRWLLRHPLPQPTMFFRRRVLERIGWFDPSFNYVFDWDFNLRAAVAGLKIARLPEPPVASFRCWHGQKTANHFTRHIEEQLRMRDRLLAAPDLPRGLVREVRFSKAWVFLWPAYQSLLAGRGQEARRYLHQAAAMHRGVIAHPAFAGLYIRCLLGARLTARARQLKGFLTGRAAG